MLAGLLLAVPSIALADVAIPPATAAAEAYVRLHEILWGLSQLAGLALALVLLLGGRSARLRDLCARLARGRPAMTRILFAVAYLTLAAAVVAPFDFWRDIVGEWGFGRAGQPLGAWAWGEVVPLLAKIVVAVFFLWIPYALLRLSPRCWWLWSAAALVPVAFAVLVALPVFVAPLTAHYQPLADKALRASIEALAARCGVAGIPVFIGGDDDTVVGLGPTNRIVLEQDITRHETPEQVVFTVGHELKHYVRGDNWTALAIIAALLLIGFFLVHAIGGPVVRRLGLGGLADPAALPLVVLLLSLLWLAVLPAFNWEARRIESEADRFGLELTHQNQAAAEMFAGWARSDHSTPEFDTFFYLFRQTHPALAERIRFANTYKPWETGEPLVYGDVCSPAARS
jgi:Zn-dependent protease with chaperone function